MSHAVSAVENDGLLRREPMTSATLFDDIDLPSLDDPSSNQVSTANSEHLSNRSVGYDRASLTVPSLPNWTPFVLRRKVLSGLISVFAGLVVALAVLFSYSQTHQGLSDADENLYYLWTYGPTAGTKPTTPKKAALTCLSVVGDIGLLGPSCLSHETAHAMECYGGCTSGSVKKYLT